MIYDYTDSKYEYTYYQSINIMDIFTTDKKLVHTIRLIDNWLQLDNIDIFITDNNQLYFLNKKTILNSASDNNAKQKKILRNYTDLKYYIEDVGYEQFRINYTDAYKSSGILYIYKIKKYYIVLGITGSYHIIKVDNILKETNINYFLFNDEHLIQFINYIDQPHIFIRIRDQKYISTFHKGDDSIVYNKIYYNLLTSIILYGNIYLIYCLDKDHNLFIICTNINQIGYVHI